MTRHDPLLDNHIRPWPAPAQDAVRTCDGIFAQIAREGGIGPLDVSLKWGQLAWRPRRPRTGSTLRLTWSPDRPEDLCLLVDCKTDLASRMASLYPDLPGNDGRRCLTLHLTGPLPEHAIAHLARMTFTYHLSADPSAKAR